MAELVFLLARAGLAPPSSRRPVAAALCAAGVGSAEALALTLERDPLFLYNQVPDMRFVVSFARSNFRAAAVAVPAPSRLHYRLHLQLQRSAAPCSIARSPPFVAFSVALESPCPTAFTQPIGRIIPYSSCCGPF